ncbi:MAG: ABC transporter substrate-binding protein [Velocimicrobium sp.]
MECGTGGIKERETMRLEHKKKTRKIVGVCVITLLLMSGCSQKNMKTSQQTYMETWLEKANLGATETKEELYEAAQSEDTLVIYTVTTRVFDVKESFEREYPGLTVEIKHVRSKDVVDQVKLNYEQEKYPCDLVICSDNDGSLNDQLVKPGIIYPYIPNDIAPKMKEGHADGELFFLGEALMLFYNGELYKEAPIKNIWELTQNKYKGKIIMANPLRSFSTYGFCSMLLKEEKQVEEAYERYKGEKLRIPEGSTASEILWEQMAPNIVFTNSSDEVAEGIGNSGKEGMELGIMISSKMRLMDIGYQFAPIYRLDPFSAVYTPNCIMIAGGCKNINAAKLFVRYILGEADGTGEGRLPYSTKGTWSTRVDAPDGNDVPLYKMDVMSLDERYIHENREDIQRFFERILNDNITE